MLAIVLRCSLCSLLVGDALLALPASAHDPKQPAALPRSIATAGKRFEAAIKAAAAGDAQAVESLALAAFGRHWALSRNVQDGVAEFDVPQVRVRTVFQIVDVRRPEAALGELIVYPANIADRWPVELDLTLSESVPTIIRQWLAAQRIPFRTWSAQPATTARDKPGLLVLGKAEAGTTIDELIKARTATSRTILVLDADWQACTAADDVRVDPLQPGMPIAPDDRPSPMVRVDRYWLGVASRRLLLKARAEEPDSPLIRPLVEFIWAKPTGEGVALSYVDWVHTLGQSEDVDWMFAELLQSLAASRTDENFLPQTVQMLWPPGDRIVSTERPVLSALMKNDSEAEVGAEDVASDRAREDMFQRTIFVLDLRGADLSPRDAASIALPDLAKGNSPTLPALLVLGADPRVQGGLFATGDASAQRKAAREFASRFQLDWIPADNLLPPDDGSFTDSESRLQQVYRLTLRWTECGAFILPTPLESVLEKKDVHH